MRVTHFAYHWTNGRVVPICGAPRGAKTENVSQVTCKRCLRSRMPDHLPALSPTQDALLRESMTADGATPTFTGNRDSGRAVSAWYRTAESLRARNLVTMDRRGDRWVARATDAGRALVAPAPEPRYSIRPTTREAHALYSGNMPIAGFYNTIQESEAKTIATALDAAPVMLKALLDVRADVEIMSRTYNVDLRPACRARLAALDAAIALATGKKGSTP